MKDENNRAYTKEKCLKNLDLRKTMANKIEAIGIKTGATPTNRK
jgi:hypothetical protein